jgi:hypothetical protein
LLLATGEYPFEIIMRCYETQIPHDKSSSTPSAHDDMLWVSDFTNKSSSRRRHLPVIINLSDNRVAELQNEILESTNKLAATITDAAIARIQPVIGQKCKGCQSRQPPPRAGRL